MAAFGRIGSSLGFFEEFSPNEAAGSRTHQCAIAADGQSDPFQDKIVKIKEL